MKLLKRKILFMLASETDFFKPGIEFSYYAYTFLYQRLLKYKPSSIRGAALQLVVSGEVDKIVRNRKPFFRLTAKGRDRLLSFFPMSIGQKKVWDRIWRIAILQRPLQTPVFVNDLRKLRRNIKKLSFKKLSRGVYITPLPVSSALKNLLLEEKYSAKITIIESRRLFLGDNKQLAKQIWPLDILLKEYLGLIKKINLLLKQLKSEKSLSKQAKVEFSLILDCFFSLLEKDPGLPKKLLFSDWPADLTRERLLRLAKGVSDPNNRLDIL